VFMKKMENWYRSTIMPKHYKEMMDEIINKMDEDAPANAVGTGANVALPPSHEPGVKKKKKDDIVMDFKKRMTESDDNNNVVLKGILDKLDKIDESIDRLNGVEKNEIEFVEEEKEYKSFRDKYNAKDI